MIRFIFKIAFVERGQEALWRGAVGRGEQYGRMMGDGGFQPVGRSELIEAHHIEDAIQILQERYPDCTVMREGSERICNA
ncbi:MAG: hypothetical protein ACJ8EY_01925 [Sphingomicrobium sp.]